MKINWRFLIEFCENFGLCAAKKQKRKSHKTINYCKNRKGSLTQLFKTIWQSTQKSTRASIPQPFRLDRRMIHKKEDYADRGVRTMWYHSKTSGWFFLTDIRNIFLYLQFIWSTWICGIPLAVINFQKIKMNVI